MINRTRRKSSRTTINSDKYCDLPEKQLSENRYKQSKLPLRFLGRTTRKPELSFILNNDLSAKFVYQKEDNLEFLFQFKWPDLGQLVNLYCDKSLLQDLKVKYVDRPKLTKKQEEDHVIWVAILKSHLQKAIRRGQTDLALATANLMFDICPLKLFRRLPIIMIEDVYLDLNCATLIWLMVYFSDRLSRCFKNDQRIKLNQRIRNFILSEVFHLCQHSVKDEIAYVQDCQKRLKSWEIKSEGQTGDQIYSLQLRKIYGGMKGDLEMIDQYSLRWLLEKNSLLIQPDFKEFDINQLIKLTRQNFILSAIDFHCCPWILEKLKTNLLKSDVIKETIWHTSSCLNYRVDYTPCNDYVKTFYLFRNKWLSLARDILEKYL